MITTENLQFLCSIEELSKPGPQHTVRNYHLDSLYYWWIGSVFVHHSNEGLGHSVGPESLARAWAFNCGKHLT